MKEVELASVALGALDFHEFPGFEEFFGEELGFVL